MYSRILFIAVSLFFAGPGKADQLRCDVKSKFACDAAGCKPNALGVWSVMDFARKTYARCDTKGCDPYPANYSRSGMFVNIDVPGRGMIAKISEDGSTFVEVVTAGTSVLLSYGSCSAN